MMINGWENYSEQQIYDIFGLYVKAGSGENKVTLPGLVRRRLMELSILLATFNTLVIKYSPITALDSVAITV